MRKGRTEEPLITDFSLAWSPTCLKSQDPDQVSYKHCVPSCTTEALQRPSTQNVRHSAWPGSTGIPAGMTNPKSHLYPMSGKKEKVPAIQVRSLQVILFQHQFLNLKTQPPTCRVHTHRTPCRPHTVHTQSDTHTHPGQQLTARGSKSAHGTRPALNLGSGNGPPAMRCLRNKNGGSSLPARARPHQGPSRRALLRPAITDLQRL